MAVALVLWAVLISPATAADAVRCEAVWRGPDATCGLSGDWAASGTGRSERAARRAAQDRLRETVEYGARLAVQKASGTFAEALRVEEVRACPDAVADEASLLCRAEAELSERRLCYADMPSGPCWSSPIIMVEGPIWKTMEQARELVCDEVDRALRARTADEPVLLACAVACRADARIRCPG